MSIINIVTLNICNDNDLIYGSDTIDKKDIDNFISYHKITNDNLITDLNKILLNDNKGYLDKSIISYNIDNNNLRSITVNLDNKIRYINNLNPEIVDDFMTKKKKLLYETLLLFDLDFILLQELDIHYIPTEELKTILSNYNILSPSDIKASYQNMLYGMLSNYILYKKKYKLIDSYLKEYGTVGIFEIDNKNVKIISGRWMPTKENKSVRLNQLKQLDNDSNMITIFAGDTNLRTNENIILKNIVDSINYFNLPKLYTIDKNKNKYFVDDYYYIARYDKIYTRNAICFFSDLIFNDYNYDLVNIYRTSGYISDHFGLLLCLTV